MMIEIWAVQINALEPLLFARKEKWDCNKRVEDKLGKKDLCALMNVNAGFLFPTA